MVSLLWTFKLTLAPCRDFSSLLKKAGQGRPNVTGQMPLGATERANRETGTVDSTLRMRLRARHESHEMQFSKLCLPADCACVTSGRDLCKSVASARAAGKMAAWVPCRRWGWAAVAFGWHRGLNVVLARKPPRAWGLPACRQKVSLSFLNRPDLPSLAYKKLKGKSPGIIFIPGYLSNMNGTKALAIEEFCKSLGHGYIRFDYSGIGNSDGNLAECTVGKWRKDVLSILDDVAEGPQILVGSSFGGWLMLHATIARPEKVVALIGIATAADGLVTQFHALSVEAQKEIEVKGQWTLPSKYSNEGFYNIPYSFIKEAERHCLLHSPIPVTCPVRLLHGMKDDIIPWHTSLQVADRVVSPDVDVILRKQSDHRMKEKADLHLLTCTIDDLIDKLSTMAN